MFRKLSLVPMALAALMCSTPVFVYADDAPKADQPIERADSDHAIVAGGVIVSVDAGNHSFVVRLDNDKDLRLSTNEQTVYTVDGKPALAAEVLMPDAKVTVTYQSGTAQNVAIHK
ncbi:MAG: hypothetical protein GC162_08385 [Planctomycetes bacterium]|nr:hypothetical protein [Planctomycetota bacterium]